MAPYQQMEELKKSIMRMPGLHMMMPNYILFENFTVIYNLNEDFDQHNASFKFEFLKMQGKVDFEAEKFFKSTVEKMKKSTMRMPGLHKTGFQS